LFDDRGFEIKCHLNQLVCESLSDHDKNAKSHIKAESNWFNDQE
jgi:hypothetical protein